MARAKREHPITTIVGSPLRPVPGSRAVRTRIRRQLIDWQASGTQRTESSTQRYRSALQPIYRDTLLTELESTTNLGTGADPDTQ